jgi:glycosyltransferase involved in cell wall biosynthesis
VSHADLTVALDATPLISGRTGIARYVTELGAALERRGVDVRRFAIGRGSREPSSDIRRIRVPLRIVERWWAGVPGPSLERFVGPADVVHAAGLLVPRTRRPLVVTVHDLAALDYPELHPDRHVRQVRALLKALDRAAVVLAVSGATADGLVARGIDRAKVLVAPLGATPLDTSNGTAADTAVVAEPGSYLLTVGEASPRKGYTTLLRAFASLGATAPRLLMVGPPAGDEARIRDTIAMFHLESRVVRLGAVSDGELAGLYQGALALCFPSVAEGFGLPVLEALAAGVPVVASDISVVREVAGDAALLVPVDDEGLMAKALHAVSVDPQLRARLADAGRHRATAFRWDRTAEVTLAAYRTATAGAYQ